MSGNTAAFSIYKNMKHKIEFIKQTWTYNHKTLIIALSLLAAHIYPLIPLPTLLYADTIVYTAEPKQLNTIDSEIEKRTIELYEQNRLNDLERYRLEAIGQINEQLQDMVYLSPHIDYNELKARYGY